MSKDDPKLLRAISLNNYMRNAFVQILALEDLTAIKNVVFDVINTNQTYRVEEVDENKISSAIKLKTTRELLQRQKLLPKKPHRITDWSWRDPLIIEMMAANIKRKDMLIKLKISDTTLRDRLLKLGYPIESRNRLPKN